jgi:polyisoprenoid-binding protein YceI
MLKLTIMKDASRKNMMSISGMMTIRERRFGMGEGILTGK